MRYLITTLICLVTLPAAVADYSLPPKHEAEYVIDKGPLTVARATTRFYPAGEDRYLYSLYLRTTGMARFFAGTRIRERSHGRLTETGYRPNKYTYHRTGDDKARRAELAFDWEQGHVRNKVDEPAWDLDIPDGTLDRVVSPLQLMRDLTVGGEEQRRMTYRIADGGELKTYAVTIGERETITTGEGRFEAVRVVRRSEDGDRETILWCAPKLAYLPVQVTRREADEDTITLELESVSGLEGEG